MKRFKLTISTVKFSSVFSHEHVGVRAGKKFRRGITESQNHRITE